MGLLDHLNNITYYKIGWDNLEDSDKKTFDPYMINRFLSMEFGYLEIINLLQKYIYSMPKRNIYQLYINFLPKKKIYNKYIRKNGNIKYDDRLYNVIKIWFGFLSKKEMNSYISLLMKDINFFKELIIKTGIPEKDANKILKKNKLF
jgi:hypothetical protein